jgi:hypothetical protein
MKQEFGIGREIVCIKTYDNAGDIIFKDDFGVIVKSDDPDLIGIIIERLSREEKVSVIEHYISKGAISKYWRLVV